MEKYIKLYGKMDGYLTEFVLFIAIKIKVIRMYY